MQKQIEFSEDPGLSRTDLNPQQRFRLRAIQVANEPRPPICPIHRSIYFGTIGGWILLGISVVAVSLKHGALAGVLGHHVLGWW
jgi:hypothetical protein